MRRLPCVGRLVGPVLATLVACATNDVSVERARVENSPANGGSSSFGGSGGGGSSAGGNAGMAGARVDSGADVAVDSPPPEDSGPFTRAALLDAFGRCAVDTYRLARDRAVALATELDAAQGDPHGSGPRGAWNAMLEIWQQAEVMQFGPAAGGRIPGALDLRNQIYSWPLTNRCEIDKNLVSLAFQSPQFPTFLVNVRGLAALEYLIFHGGPDNACAANLPINTTGSWVALGQVELGSRRLGYARAAATDVRGRAQALLDAWEPTDGNFLGQFTAAGAGSSVYATDQAGFNAVSDGLFYVEAEVKDEKLARPLGIAECTAATCPEALESLFAGRSKQHIRNNLIGFKKIFVGCAPEFSGFGFADLLSAMGATELAGQMEADLDAAIAAGDAIEENDLAVALTTDYASARAWFDAIKRVTDALKTDFVTTLDLGLPERVKTDND